VRASEESYRAQLAALLPKGLIWPKELTALLHTLLGAIGAVFANTHNRLLDLIEEADPRTTLELLPDWERILGLPDPCTPSDVELTLQERRARVVQKLTLGGGQSPAFYIALAASIGYAIEIEEFRPFICGLSHCGDPIGGAYTDRYYWRVTVPGPRVTYFRTGASRCGDSLGLIARAEDLQCIFEESKPGHTRLLFSYEGA